MSNQMMISDREHTWLIVCSPGAFQTGAAYAAAKIGNNQMNNIFHLGPAIDLSQKVDEEKGS